MFCPKCGVENADDRELCASCSNDLKSHNSQPTVEAQTSGVAIAALVLGLLSLTLVLPTGLPAIICGIIALVKIGGSNGRLKGKGLAITGIVVPLLVIPLLLAMLSPALAKVKGMAQRVICETNLKSLSIATMTYSIYYDDEFPTGGKWCDLLIERADVSPILFSCKSRPAVDFAYGFNENLEGLTFNDADADIVMMFEIESGRNATGGPELLYTGGHHDEGCNIAFVDGRVEFIKTEDLPNLKWKP